MKHLFFSAYETIILRRPKVSLLLTLLVIGWLSMHIPSFKLDASSDSLVLEGDEDLKYYREISKRYASGDYLVVTYQPTENLMTDESLATLDQLRGELAALDGVSSVVSILDVPLLESPKVTLDEIAGGDGLRSLRTPNIDKKLVLAELTNSPIYENLLTSADGQTTALQVNLQRDEKHQSLLALREGLREREAKKELSSAEQQQLREVEQEFRDYAAIVNQRQSDLVDSVRAIVLPYRDHAQLFLGGVPMIAADMIAFVKSDLVVFGSGIMCFIVITLSVIFRRPTWVILPLVTCALSTAFMLGLITWLDWRMTVISSNFVALLLIITLSITIHLVVYYREMVLTYPELTQRELVTRTALFMSKPCIYTSLTTMVAFASLVVSGIRPVIDFGWMMTVGVTVALVISFIIIPCTLMLLPKPKRVVAVSDESWVTLKFAELTERYGGFILWGSAILAIISVLGITRLEVENRFIDYFHESTEIYQGMEVIDAQLGGTIPLDIIIDAEQEEVDDVIESVVIADESNVDDDEFFDDFGGGFEDDFSGDDLASAGSKPSYWFNRAGLNRIEQVHDYLDGLDETGKVMSLATPYKVLRGLTTGIDDIQLALIQSKLPADINAILVDPYLNEDIDQARISVRVKETSHSLRRADLLAQIQNHLVNELGFQPEKIHLTGMLVLYNNMLQSLYRSQILTIGAVFVAIVLMFLVLFRSLSLALISITPNFLTAGMVLGGMGWAGIPLDIMTVTIAAISVGIAVDDTIHYVYRFRSEFAKDQNYIATMHRCHRSIGKAMFYTSVINHL